MRTAGVRGAAARWGATTTSTLPPRVSTGLHLRPGVCGGGAAAASARAHRTQGLGASWTLARFQRCKRLSEVEASATEETSQNHGRVVEDSEAESSSGARAAAEAQGFASTTAVKEEVPSDQATTPGTNDVSVDSSVESKAAESSTLKAHPIQLPQEDMFGSKELWGELQDKKGFGKRGEGWFFAQGVVLLLILFPPIPVKGLVDLLGILAVTAGLVFIIYGVFSLGRQISPLPVPREKHKLVTSGMYGYVRHPMYGGLLMASLGLAALTRSEGRLALSALLWWVLEQKAAFEEKSLGERHQGYEEYKKRVNKFFPFIY